jgi:uncharacterized SAM-binding protein YcdF (DUF218 family)
VAEENSWATRIARMSTLVSDVLESRTARETKWEEALRRVYRRARGRTTAVVAVLALAYVLLFRTNLAWTLARPLEIVDAPRPGDAIVVLAGGVGESGQAGGGYQERVKQAVELYRAGLAPRMIFSSGYVFAYSEAGMMRDLAVDQGAPASAILLEEHARNTHENVLNVAAILKAHGWTRVLLVSSPYHMRRAVLTWKKAAPGVDVISTPVPASQFYAHDRGASVDQMRGLAHEYAAIAAYWLKGWI